MEARRPGRESGACSRLRAEVEFDGAADAVESGALALGAGGAGVGEVVGGINAELAEARGGIVVFIFVGGFGIHGKTRPWPRHVGHQPRGELKEKFFGSSWGNSRQSRCRCGWWRTGEDVALQG